MGLFDLFSSDMDRDIRRMEEGLRRIQEKKERERKGIPLQGEPIPSVMDLS